MGRNIEEGTSGHHCVISVNGYQAQVKKKRGRPNSGVYTPYKKKTDEPRTPFDLLLRQLEMTYTSMAKECGITISAVAAICRGSASASVPLAKRIQEVALQRGFAVTLDELFQHILAYNPEHFKQDGD